MWYDHFIERKSEAKVLGVQLSDIVFKECNIDYESSYHVDTLCSKFPLTSQNKNHHSQPAKNGVTPTKAPGIQHHEVQNHHVDALSYSCHEHRSQVCKC